MADQDDSVFIEQRLTRTETLIVNVETALDALLTGSQSYTYESIGNNRVTVTKANLSELKNTLATLEERRRDLRSQLGLANTVGKQIRVTPAF